MVSPRTVSASAVIVRGGAACVGEAPEDTQTARSRTCGSRSPSETRYREGLLAGLGSLDAPAAPDEVRDGARDENQNDRERQEPGPPPLSCEDHRQPPVVGLGPIMKRPCAPEVCTTNLVSPARSARGSGHSAASTGDGESRRVNKPSDGLEPSTPLLTMEASRRCYVIRETRLIARFPCNSLGFFACDTLPLKNPGPPRKAPNLSPEPSPKGTCTCRR